MNTSILYLDHSATTPVCPEAVEAMMQVLRDGYGNPSSRHTLGRQAAALVQKATEQIMDALGVKQGALIFTSLYFLILYRYAEMKTANLVGNVLALLLVGMTFIAIGVFVSALTENQLSAAIGTMAIILAFLAIGALNSLLPANFWLRYVLNCFSLFTRFQTFTNGYFDLSSLLYYLSVSAVFVYLTIRVYDRRRYN